MKLIGLKKLIEDSNTLKPIDPKKGGSSEGGGRSTNAPAAGGGNALTNFATGGGWDAIGGALKSSPAILETPPRQLVGGALGMGSVTGFSKNMAADYIRHGKRIISAGTDLVQKAAGMAPPKLQSALSTGAGGIATAATAVFGDKVAKDWGKEFVNAAVDLGGVAFGSAAGDFRIASLGDPKARHGKAFGDFEGDDEDRPVKVQVVPTP